MVTINPPFVRLQYSTSTVVGVQVHAEKIVRDHTVRGLQRLVFQLLLYWGGRSTSAAAISRAVVSPKGIRVLLDNTVAHVVSYPREERYPRCHPASQAPHRRCF